jgi:hypothetical protein
MPGEPDPAAAATDPAAGEPIIDAAPRAGSPWYTDVLGDALTGAGVIGLGVAGYLYLDARRLADDAAAAPTLIEHDRLDAKAGDRQLQSIIVASAGAALIAGGVVRYLTRDDGSEPAATSVSIAPLGRGAGVGLVLGGRF